MAGRLPGHRQIVTWGNPDAEKPTAEGRTFNEILTDKSTFYHRNAPKWDKAALSSYQYTDDVRIIDGWGAWAIRSKRPGETIVDYGPGATDKMLPITRALPEGSHYLAVDMDRPFLKHTIPEVAASNPGITSAGIQSSFEHFPQILELIAGPKLIVSFGSNLLNHPEPVEQMRPIVEKLNSKDRIYLSIDCHGKEDEAKVAAAYKSADFMEFIEGTLKHIEGYKAEQWDLESGLREAPLSRYSFTLTAKENVKIRDELYPKDTCIEFFPCYKSSEAAVHAIASEVGLRIADQFNLDDSKMYHFILEKP